MRLLRPGLVIVLAFVLGGCGSSSSTATSTSSTTTATSAAAPTSTTSVNSNSIAECKTTGLDVSVTNSDAGAGNRYLTFGLRNKNSTPCSLNGYPGMALYNGTSEAISSVSRSGTAGEPVVINSDQRAYFDIHYVVVESGTDDTCVPITRAAITPPNETAQLSLPITQIDRLCINTGVSVTSVRSTSAAA